MGAAPGAAIPQLGLPSEPGELVILTGLEPSAFMTYISESPLRSDMNAILVLSGDHAGDASYVGWSVRFTWLEPSASITQMSKNPDRWDAKAILFPSGDQDGSLSQPELSTPKTTGLLEIFIGFDPSESIMNTSESPCPPSLEVKKAILELSEDHDGMASLYPLSITVILDPSAFIT